MPTTPTFEFDSSANDVREGFLRLVAGHRLRASQQGRPIESVTRAELAERTPMWRGYDPEFALLGYAGEAFTSGRRGYWDEQRAGLRTQIAQTRSLLAQHALVINDQALTASLADRQHAIEAFDIDGDGLPFPDDNDFTAVEGVLQERIDAVGRILSAQQIPVDPQVLLRSVTDGYIQPLYDGESAYNGYNWAGGARGELVAATAAADPEIELVTRLHARDAHGQEAAATLLSRIYWQRETLRQVVADAVSSVMAPVEPPITKSFTALPAVDSPITVIGRLYLLSLAELINLSHAAAAAKLAHQALAIQSTTNAPAMSPASDGWNIVTGWASDYWHELIAPGPNEDMYAASNYASERAKTRFGGWC